MDIRRVSITLNMVFALAVVGSFQPAMSMDSEKDAPAKPNTLKRIVKWTTGLIHKKKNTKASAAASASASNDSGSEKTEADELSKSAVILDKSGPVAVPADAKVGDDLAKPPTAADVQTTQAANRVPGVHASPQLMAQPVLDPPYHGWNPIKRIMNPVENLAKQSVVLGQQIMRLEAPIAGLQPSMIGLDQRMVGVQGQMKSMQGNLGGMQTQMKSMQGNLGGMQNQVGGVRQDMHTVGQQMTGVRSDLSTMESDIRQIHDPLVKLHQPIVAVARPVEGVQRQLASVDQQLTDLKTLLGTVLLSIYIAAAAICVGTPVAAFLVYKNRRKLFPHTHEHDFPAATSSDKKNS